MPQDAFYTQLPAPRTLVDGIFKGGGTGGIVYVGSLMALARHGVWFKRTAGTSAGSIIAAMIAAGYDANECDYLAAPSGVRSGSPDNLPPGAEPLNYRSLLDLPSSPDDVTLESRRNNLLHHAIGGATIDELLKIPVSLPSLEPIISRIVDQVVAELPSSIGPVKVKVGPFKVKVGPLMVDTDRYDVEVGPLPVPLTDLKPLIQGAVAGVLQAYPRSMKLDETGLLAGEDRRQGFADAVMSTLMTAYPFLIVYLHFLGDGGLFKGDAFLQSMRRILEAKVGRNPVRFLDLPMELACAACDVTSHELEVYSTKTTPEMEVAEAVRRSMSIPFFFAPRREERHEIMDGSIIDNSAVGFYLARDNGYFENTPEDMQRVKIGFRPSGAGLGPAVDVEKILAQQMPGGRQIPTTVEGACLKRAVNIAVASMQESPLLTAMLRELKNAVNYYEISGELENHNPVDFDITPAKFSRLCSKGWQGAMPQIKQGVGDGNLNLATALNEENPYQ
jgi:predicted acylesterase/phospholipase RssA